MKQNGRHNLGQEPGWRVLADFTVRDLPGDDLRVLTGIAHAVQMLSWQAENLQSLYYAVAAAIAERMLSARESGPPAPVRILITTAANAYPVGQPDRPARPGWGFFLIQQQAANGGAANGQRLDQIEIVLYLEGL